MMETTMGRMPEFLVAREVDQAPSAKHTTLRLGAKAVAKLVENEDAAQTDQKMRVLQNAGVGNQKQHP